MSDGNGGEEGLALLSPAAVVTAIEEQDRAACLEHLRFIQLKAVEQSKFIYPENTTHETWAPPLFAAFLLRSDAIDAASADILKAIFNTMEPNTFFALHKDAMKELSAQPNSAILRTFAVSATLEQLLKLQTDDDFKGLSDVWQYFFMLAIRDKEISVANAALSLVDVLVGKFAAFKEWALLPDTWEQVDGESDTVQLRALSLLKDVCMSSADIKKAFADTHLIEKIFSRINLDDPLAAIAILELLASICESVNLFSLLREFGLFELFEKVLGEGASDPLTALAAPQVVDLLSAIVQFSGVLPEVCEHVDVLAYLSTIIADDASSTQASAIVALAALSQSPDATAVLPHKVSFGAALKKVAQLTLSGGDSARQEHAIKCLGSVFSSLDENDDTRVLFSSVCVSPLPRASVLSVVVSLLTSPFSDLRLAAYRFVFAVCMRQDARENLMQVEGFFSTITDRKEALDYDTSSVRYDVVKLLNDFPPADLSAEHTVLLEDLVRRGPFTVDHEVHAIVETEGGL